MVGLLYVVKLYWRNRFSKPDPMILEGCWVDSLVLTVLQTLCVSLVRGCLSEHPEQRWGEVFAKLAQQNFAINLSQVLKKWYNCPLNGTLKIIIGQFETNN